MNGARGAMNDVGNSVRAAARKTRAPLLFGAATAAGVAGGLALGSRLVPRRRVLGIPLPRRGGLDGVARQIGKAATEFGTLADEVRKTRSKAEDVGKALS